MTCRSIGYYLEGLVCLAPFAKKPFNVTLSGITNDERDISVRGPACLELLGLGLTRSAQVDMFRTVTLPLLTHFGIEEDLELKVHCTLVAEGHTGRHLMLASMVQINRRGAPPKGGGEILFRCPVVRSLKPCSLLNAGKVTKIRGIV